MKRSGKWWPFAIVAVFVLNASVMAWVMVVSHRDHSFAVEKDYYTKALNWDEHARERDASDALGWTATAVFETDAPRTLLVVRIADRDSSPVADASVIVHAFHRSYPAEAQTLALAERAPGEFACPVADPRAGWWCIQIDAVRADERFRAECLAGFGIQPIVGK